MISFNVTCQVFLSENLFEDVDVDLPIPIIFASSFQGDGVHDFLVTEDLCANKYFQVICRNKDGF